MAFAVSSPAEAKEIAREERLSRPLQSTCDESQECWDYHFEELSIPRANQKQLACLSTLKRSIDELNGIPGWVDLSNRLETPKFLVRVADNADQHVKDGPIAYGARRMRDSDAIEIRARWTPKYGCDLLTSETLFFQLESIAARKKPGSTVSSERAFKETQQTGEEALESLNLPDSLSAYF